MLRSLSNRFEEISEDIGTSILGKVLTFQLACQSGLDLELPATGVRALVRLRLPVVGFQIGFAIRAKTPDLQFERVGSN